MHAARQFSLKTQWQTREYIIEGGRVMQRSGIWALLWVVGCWLSFGGNTTAGLIESTSGATLLFSGHPNYNPALRADEVIKLDDSGFTGSFFGKTYFGSIYASEDGNINFSNDDNYYPNSRTNVARIAPLWDDYLFDASLENRMWAHKSDGYIGVTWENVTLLFETVAGEKYPDSTRSFQALWFDKETQIRGSKFLAGDIAFSYSGNVISDQPGGVHASFVGLRSGGVPGTNVILPGTETTFGPDFGLLYDGDAAKLGLGYGVLGENDFLLFRPTGDTYALSRESITAVPEPSSVLCIAIVMSLCYFLRYLKNRKYAIL